MNLDQYKELPCCDDVLMVDVLPETETLTGYIAKSRNMAAEENFKYRKLVDRTDDEPTYYTLRDLDRMDELTRANMLIRPYHDSGINML